MIASSASPTALAKGFRGSVQPSSQRATRDAPSMMILVLLHVFHLIVES